jgi:hypothetical protein
MEGLGAGFTQMELKYCERCGALWLRLSGSDAVFCGACATAMAGLPPKLHGRGRPAAGVIRECLPEEGAFWAEGGNA